jgi:hypothetical protein
LPIVALVAAASAAAAIWQVEPLVLVEAGNPVLCGYVYTHRDDGVSLRVEKGVRGGGVFTAVEVRGAGLARLTTASFDSDRDLQPSAQLAEGSVRSEGDLEERDAGGLLFAELAVTGGTLQVARRGAEDAQGLPAWIRYMLPAPLPRGVSAMYLNCAGDLIRPE